MALTDLCEVTYATAYILTMAF